MNKTILIIEDDPHIRLGLNKALQMEGYQVLTANDGEQGLWLAQTENPALIVVDIMMPKMNGFEVIAALRSEGNETPLIVLSARTETQDKVRGLKLGADDYVEKPFALAELLERIERKLDSQTQQQVTFGEFNIDFKTECLSENGNSIVLSAKEIKLLQFMLQRVGQIVSREQIISAVWGGDYYGTDRTVDNFILGLRKKIGKG
ncbi:MAG: response regulator transcription factor, partial [Algicola sp.]|nr:response regulator transcription factor [Algicola sp.]